MNQKERRIYLIKELLREDERYDGTVIPEDERGQRMLLRSLMNVREAAPVSEVFLAVQDEYLREEKRKSGITELSSLKPVKEDERIYLWQGDITSVRCDAIVNAANSGLTGCYYPCHNCIDNCIHTFAGIQLRNYCARIMNVQGHEEETGKAKITPAFNLPCRYVLHTVGPIVNGKLTRKHEALLASCYRSCLELAEKNNVESIAFCCISTGVFGFPKHRAAEIAIGTVKKYYETTGSRMKVIFNVFTDEDKEIYQELLK